MRGLIRLLVVVGLVAGSTSLAPVVGAAAAAVAPVATIDPESKPQASTSKTSGRFTFSADQPGAVFECSLVAQGAPSEFRACSTEPTDPSDATPNGADVYSGLKPGTYTFAVHATSTKDPSVVGPDDTYTWTVVPPPAAPVTTIDPATVPDRRTIEPGARFSFSADGSDVTFQCRLTGPGRTSTAYSPCSSATPPTGSQSYTVTRPGTYTFAVHATSTKDPSVVGQDDTYTWTVICSVRRTVCTLTAPGRYTVPGGARFNNPLGTSAAQRRLLDHVTNTVSSMPGYAVDPSLCSANPADYPSTIRVSLYSLAHSAFSRAMIAAANRCVSVQILMNNHLDPANVPAIRMLLDEFGTRVRTDSGALRRNFARMCGGCRGHGVLHSKFYLFDSARKAVNNDVWIHDTVMVGSSNMTGNASQRQWNNLQTVRSNPELHGQYLSMFDRMKWNVPDNNTYDLRTGDYLTQFWPRGASDPQMAALRSIRCTGVTGGAGVNGRSIVYINIHAWFGTRGYAMAEQVRRLYGQGCYVRVLYGFMSYSVYKKLKLGTNSRMSVRRTIFSFNGDQYADVYSHFKTISASGYIGGDSSAWVTWTGSMNFTNSGVGFDEVMMRISSATTYRQYRDQFSFISRRKSSAVYASYLEPGSQPPETKAAIADGGAQAPATTVLPQRSLTGPDGAPLD